MAGTREGGRKAAITNKQKYGEGFYSTIGKSGGESSGTGGFYHSKYVKGDNNFAIEAGRKGGRISRRKSKEIISG